MLDRNIGLIPEDRHGAGIIPRMSIAHNLSLIWLKLNSRFGKINIKQENEMVKDSIVKMNIKPNEPKKHSIFLSGGNQQKVVVGKCMAVDPQILLLDDPTRGIDVGAKSEIHQIIARKKAEGAAILMTSSELSEVLNVADRIYVLHNGKDSQGVGGMTPLKMR